MHITDRARTATRLIRFVHSDAILLVCGVVVFTMILIGIGNMEIPQ